MQNASKAQEFGGVAKTLAGVVDLKRAREDAFCGAGARISSSKRIRLDVLDVECVEGLQILRAGSFTFQRSFHVTVTGLRMPRLLFLQKRSKNVHKMMLRKRARI